jgi:cadmium resistance protein CadD (predicted permease)
MDNRKRATGITSGIMLIVLGILMLALQFPYITTALISSSVLGYGLYQIFLGLREMIEDYLNEEDATIKWKQDKNIK